MFRVKPGRNRSSRPLDVQLLLEIPIRTEWKTFRAPNKNQKHKKSIFGTLCWDYVLRAISTFASNIASHARVAANTVSPKVSALPITRLWRLCVISLI